MEPVVQIITEEENIELFGTEQKAMTKHSMEIGVRLDWNLTQKQQTIIFRIKEVVKSGRREAFPSQANSVAQYITTSHITCCNKLLYAVALVVSEQLRKIRKGKGKTKPKKCHTGKER